MSASTVKTAAYVPCEGSRQPSGSPTPDGRGYCLICELLVSTYDSSRGGRQLSVDHDRKCRPGETVIRRRPKTPSSK